MIDNFKFPSNIYRKINIFINNEARLSHWRHSCKVPNAHQHGRNCSVEDVAWKVHHPPAGLHLQQTQVKTHPQTTRHNTIQQTNRHNSLQQHHLQTLIIKQQHLKLKLALNPLQVSDLHKGRHRQIDLQAQALPQPRQVVTYHCRNLKHGKQKDVQLRKKKSLQCHHLLE